MIKFCKKCQVETERNPWGKCKPCVVIRRVKYRLANPEKVKASAAKYRLANSEKVKAYAAKYRLANPEKKKVHDAKYQRQHPELSRIKKQNRRAQKRANGGRLSRGLAQRLFKLQEGKCVYCKVELNHYHLDHVMPIKLGGANEDGNIQLLCPTCNYKKGAKHPLDFVKELTIKN